MAIVYITTNLVNGKKYIGSHKDNNEKYLGSGVNLKKAIQKYGKDNFERKTIWEGEEEDRYRVEELLIAEHNAVESKQYYNASHKGTGLPKGYQHTQETLDKYRDERIARIEKNRSLDGFDEWRDSEDFKVHIKELNKKINSDRSIIDKRNTTLREKWKNQDHPNKGVPKTQEWKDSRKVECEHCGIVCDKSNYTKWHGDKCKKKDENTEIN